MIGRDLLGPRSPFRSVADELHVVYGTFLPLPSEASAMACFVLCNAKASLGMAGERIS